MAAGSSACANCGQDLTRDLPGRREDDTGEFPELQQKLRQTGRDWAHPAAYRVGEAVLGRYEIVDVLGAGPLGTVYKATDQEQSEEVALKVIEGELFPDAAAREHFIETIEALGDLSHGNVIDYRGAHVDGDRCCYVTEFLEGLTLRKIIQMRREKGQVFSAAEVAPICAQLCRALGESGVVHGGLKPENVVILPDLLKITDLALPAALPRQAYVAAQRRAAGDALTCIAPEVREAQDYDQRADVYSLAAIVVELLTGQPFRGTVAGLAGRGLRDAGTLEAALRRALDRDADERFDDALQLGAAIGACLGDAPARVTMQFGAEAEGAAQAAVSDEGLWPGATGPGVEEERAPTMRQPAHRMATTQPYGAIGLDERATRPIPRPAGDTGEVTRQAPQPEDAEETEDSENTERVNPASLTDDASPAEDEPLALDLRPPARASEEERAAGDPGPVEADFSDATIPLTPENFPGGAPAGAAFDPDPAVAAKPKEGSQATHQLQLDEVEFEEEADGDERLVLEASAPSQPAAAAAVDARPAEEATQQRREATYQVSAEELESLKVGDDEEHEDPLLERPPPQDHEATIPRASMSREDLLQADLPEEELFPLKPAAAGAPEVVVATPERWPQVRLGGRVVTAEDTDSVSGETQTDPQRDLDGSPALTDDLEGVEPVDELPRGADFEAQTSRARDVLHAFGDAGADDGRITSERELPGASPLDDGPVRRAEALGVAPEVLHRDAVPEPLDVSHTYIERPKSGGRSWTLPVVMVLLAVVGSTIGALFYLQMRRQQQARAEFDAKRARMMAQAAQPSATPISTGDEDAAAAAVAVDATAVGEPPAPRPPDPPSGAQPIRPAPQPVPAAPRPRERPAKHVVAVAPPRERRTTPRPARPLPLPKPTPAPAPPSRGASTGKCFKGMVFVAASGVCIDRYEAPGAGRMPHRVSQAQARSACRARGMRLCSAREWMRACGGLFPYGRAYEAGRCVTGEAKARPAGSRRRCRSGRGVYDLSGNVAEWVEEGAAMGGDFSAAGAAASCTSRATGGAVGYRCCSEPVDDWE